MIISEMSVDLEKRHQYLKNNYNLLDKINKTNGTYKSYSRTIISYPNIDVITIHYTKEKDCRLVAEFNTTVTKHKYSGFKTGLYVDISNYCDDNEIKK